jgi:hypothetical protein
MRFITYGWYRRACYIMLAVVAAYGIGSFFDSLFACQPIQYFWDKTISGGSCLDRQVTWMTNAALDIITDVVIIILPMPAISVLNLPRKQKIFITIIFATGGL